MNIDLIPTSQLTKNYISFIKALDERIQSSPQPDIDNLYQAQIREIIGAMIAMKENGSNYLMLDEKDQEIIRLLLERELC